MKPGEAKMPNRSIWIRAGLFVGLVALIVAAFTVVDLLQSPRTIAVAGRTRGSADAKVTLVEFSDFQ
jgi:hypothetical protein